MLNRMKIFTAVASLSVIAIACGTKDASSGGNTVAPATQAPMDKAAAEAEIRALDTVFFGAVAAHDADAMASTYANDAISMPANSPIQKGHDAIQKADEEFLKTPKVAMTGGTDMIRFSDDGTVAYATGTYHATWTDAKGKPAAEDGKFLNVMKKIDGKWKIVADAYSGNAPPKM